MRMCKSCDFFVVYKDTNGGHCHRYPPQLYVMRFENVPPQVISEQPYMEQAEWCGEYKPANNYA